MPYGHGFIPVNTIYRRKFNMNGTMNKKEFTEKVLQYVKDALPEELAEAQVCTTSLDLWADGARMVLLVIHPWDSTTVGFCLDKWYQGYLDKKETAETTAAAVINDRRLYCIPQGDSMDLEGGAVIYA